MCHLAPLPPCEVSRLIGCCGAGVAYPTVGGYGAVVTGLISRTLSLKNLLLLASTSTYIGALCTRAGHSDRVR